ncbi:NAC transcription factor 29-like [Forsythia ovata]|uniref:NAC transcription factor 29-like n=1 Tax=Forsythia ovata TaxID=205694 RepID=A0ABD1X745_9LAMI
MEKNPIFSTSFPPGIRFHPSDEELIVYYLLNKVKSLPLPANVIADTQLYDYDPWELARKAVFGEDEWYFFTPRDRKYPNGGRPNRRAASGYWKATGIDNPILSSSGSQKIGVKKALVFYIGRPPKGVKTDWMMTEYRLPETTSRPLSSKGSMRLDDWVLCRIRLKGNMSKNAREIQKNTSEVSDYLPMIDVLPSAYGGEKILDYFSSSYYHQKASLLIGNEPTTEFIPKAPTQNHNNGKGNNDQTPNSWFQSLFNSPNEENKGTDIIEEHRSEGDKFNINSSNAMTNCLELYMPPLSESFLQ